MWFGGDFRGWVAASVTGSPLGEHDSLQQAKDACETARPSVHTERGALQGWLSDAVTTSRQYVAELERDREELSIRLAHARDAKQRHLRAWEASQDHAEDRAALGAAKAELLDSEILDFEEECGDHLEGA